VLEKGTYGAGARSFQGTFANQLRKSACHVAGMSIDPIASPAHDSPPNIAASPSRHLANGEVERVCLWSSPVHERGDQRGVVAEPRQPLHPGKLSS
jgi:hypothetical protein